MAHPALPHHDGLRHLRSEKRLSSASTAVLANDVILDNILTELDVHDVLRLRQVSTQYRSLTNEPATWKRLIAEGTHQLPPVPPTTRYSFANLTSVEAERLISRAVDLPARWNRPSQTALRRWDIDAHRNVLEMALLPGGQYIVASIVDSKGQHSVEVLTSDYGYAVGFPVAQVKTSTRAFGVQAKYLTSEGVQGIAIAYTRRDYKREKYSFRFNIDDYEPQEDIPERLAKMIKYVCTVVHVPLDDLERFCDDTRPPNVQRSLSAHDMRPPFRLLADIVSRSRISNTIIAEDVEGTPYVTVLKGTDRVLFKNLDGGLGCTMQCTPHPDFVDLPHAILAFTVLFAQQQFFIVRRAGPNEAIDGHGPYYFTELYPITYRPSETLTLPAAARTAALDSRGNIWRQVMFSDPTNPHELPGCAPSVNVPPPLLIFVGASKTYGVIYEALFPEPIPPPPSSTPTEHETAEAPGTAPALPRYAYNISEDMLQLDPLPAEIDALAEVYDHIVLPGALRPLVCTIPRRPSAVDGSEADWEHGLGDEGSTTGSVATSSTYTGGFDVRALSGVLDDRLVCTPEIPQDTPPTDAPPPDPAAPGDADGTPTDDGGGDDDGTTTMLALAARDLRGVAALAWDETINRLCVAYARSTRVAVFDFAPGARLPRGCRYGVRSDEFYRSRG
ncbi:uncharacterized protein BXZ73DRAFT_82900 [Epithele typhae]|uniref:uncharacterized protein n=1 Tax=Epithele typhae TaxID=378194 RepID=UPI0020080949|nr:uncharacterized protein BXZ73DRAFT_82900 [Epithele typhae]KAH9911275.1 hypothetical protein BXZ73DRAFT_82900 [Epithele typhae]